MAEPSKFHNRDWPDNGSGISKQIDILINEVSRLKHEREDDLSLGKGVRLGKAILACIAAIVVATLSSVGYVELRAGSIAKTVYAEQTVPNLDRTQEMVDRTLRNANLASSENVSVLAVKLTAIEVSVNRMNQKLDTLLEQTPRRPRR